MVHGVDGGAGCLPIIHAKGNRALRDPITVAIDGPSGAGKSTIARAAAKRFGLLYVDTGAIYRTVAYAARQAGADCRDEASVSPLLPGMHIRMAYDAAGVQRMYLENEDVSDAIRMPEISALASQVSAHPAVRAFLLDMQRSLAAAHSVIMDGRDIGTVVLPDADVKIFLTASAEVRARRRFLELQQRGAPDTYEQVLADMKERDYRDSHREIAPLRPAQDAIVIDSSDQTLEENVQAILSTIRGKLQ